MRKEDEDVQFRKKKIDAMWDWCKKKAQNDTLNLKKDDPIYAVIEEEKQREMNG